MTAAERERCLLLCKDKNFKANHNYSAQENKDKADVCYYAKIRILKQITTLAQLRKNVTEMFVIMQR